MVYIKKVIEIGSGENSTYTEDVFGISGEFDIDNLCGTLSFNLPYWLSMPDSTVQQGVISDAGVNTNALKKFDSANLYFAEFDTDPGDVTQVDTGEYQAGGITLTKIFEGFIDTIKLSKSKSNINYELGCLGSMGISNYRNLTYQHTEGVASELIPTLLQISGLQQGQFNVYPVDRDLIPANKIRFIDVDSQNRILITDGGTSLKEVIDKLREKYALIFHQSGDGYFNIMTPFSLVQPQNNSTLSVFAWNFDINLGNLYEIDNGDLTMDYNAIVVLGAPPIYGIAVDVIAVQNNGGQVNYLIHENRDLQSDEDCQKVARDKLFDLNKNYIITLKTKFDPNFMVGQPVTINDNDRFNGTQVFTLKKYSFSISKDDVSCSVQVFNNSSNFIPPTLANDPSGVYDVDILNIRDKELDSNQWGKL